MTKTLKDSSTVSEFQSAHFSVPKRFTVAEFDPETCQYSISQAQNLCVAIKDYLEDVSSQVVAYKKNPLDEVTRAIIANAAIDRVEIWQTLLSQVTDQLNDADANLQIAIDNLYHKENAQ